MKQFKKGKVDVSPIILFLLALYIVLTFIVGQIIDNLASKTGGIVMIAPVFIMLIVHVMNHKAVVKFKFTYFDTYMLIFTVYCLTSSLWSIEPTLAISKGVDIFETFLLMIIIAVCIRKMYSIDTLLKTIMYAYYLVIFYEIVFYGWDYFVSVMNAMSRVTSEYLNANTLGLCAAFAVLINIYLLLQKKTAVWTIGLATISIVILSASGSRKALFSLVAGILLILLFRSFRKEKKSIPFVRFLITLPLIIFVIYHVLQLPIFSGISERMIGMINIVFGGTVEKSALIRRSLVHLGSNLFKEHPIIGIGIDNPRLYTYGIVGESYYLHNNFIELLASGGILGFIAYYWIYAKLIVSYIKHRDFNNPQYIIVLTLLLLRLVLDYGMVSYYSKTTYVFLLLFVIYDKQLSLGNLRTVGGN